MPEKPTKRQHIVPVFYLKHFCNSAMQLNVYDTEKGKFFYSAPENICVENYIYETEFPSSYSGQKEFVDLNSIEKDFRKEEAVFAPLLDHLICICETNQPQRSLVCRKEEKRLLSEFVANLYLRNPYVFQGILERQYPVAELRKTEIYKATADAFTKFDNMIQELVDCNASHFVKRAMFKPSITGSPAHEAVNRFLEMHPVFFRSSSLSFITSSRPVVWILIKESEEEEEIGNAIFFPLSPKVLLMYTDMPHARCNRNRIVELSAEMVTEFNRDFLVPRFEPVRFLIAQDCNDFAPLVSEGIFSELACNLPED